MTMRRIPFIVVSALLSFSAYSEDLGSYGNNYAIKEKDAAQLLKDTLSNKLANGGQERIIKEAQQRFINKMSDIPPAKGITVAKLSKTRLVDISETVSKPIYDNKNQLIVAAGTVINPLKNKPLNKKVFFIDWRIPAQLDFVKKQAGPSDKVILLAGNLWTTQKYLNRNAYLDMGLSQRMQIQVTPSVASQGENFKLKIEEIAF
jgi:type-F conjugative transfer system protein TraW